MIKRAGASAGKGLRGVGRGRMLGGLAQMRRRPAEGVV